MKKLIAILMSTLLSTSIVVYAEGNGEPSILGKTLNETLSPLEVLLKPSVRLDPIVVTPTRYKDPSLNVSSNVTIIDEKQIRNSQIKYVPDLLRSAVGIVVGDFSGNGKNARIDMRGFGDSAASNVLVLVDGRRTNQIDMSGADWTQIDVDAIERIEIVRGPQTVLYGDNATGGVVNIITKTGKDAKHEMGFKTERGSYKYFSYKGHMQGGSDFLDYYAMIATSYNNGYRINSYLETLDYSTSLTVKPADFLKMHFDAGYHKDWYGLPGAVKPADINNIGRRGSIYPDNKAKTEDYYIMITPEIKYDFGFGETFFSSDISYRARRTNSSNPIWDMARANHIKTFGLTPKLAFTTNFLDIDNRIMTGFDFYTSKDQINDGWLAEMDTIVINKDTFGAYISDTVKLPFSLILNGGFRAEWAYYKFDQQAQLQGKNEKKPFEYAYNVNLSYKYNDRSSIYATYSRSFRFPVIDEWYQSMYTDSLTGRIAGGLNLDLKPQVVYNYEIGLKENSSKYIGLTADYYIMDIKNELYFDSVTHKNSIYHHTIHHGLELKGDVYILDSIHAFANYAYQKAFFVGESFAGNEIPLVPRHKLSVGFDYIFMDCVNFSYIANYIGERYFGNDLQNNMPRLKCYTVHDIKMSYIKHGIEIFCAINNIFDKIYSEYGILDRALTNPGYYPSPRRNFSIGIKYKF